MLKTKVTGGARGDGNCCVAGEDLHRDFMYVNTLLFSVCADVYTFRNTFN